MTDWIDKLTELRRQREAGAIDAAEFEARRSAIFAERDAARPAGRATLRPIIASPPVTPAAEPQAREIQAQGEASSPSATLADPDHEPAAPAEANDATTPAAASDESEAQEAQVAAPSPPAATLVNEAEQTRDPPPYDPDDAAPAEHGHALSGIDGLDSPGRDPSQATSASPDLEALEQDPKNLHDRATLAARQAVDDAGWQDGLGQLIAIQAESPDEPYVTDLLADAYLHHAYRGWTSVAPEADETALIGGIRKAIRIVQGGEVSPGLYPTKAEHIKAATVVLSRLMTLKPAVTTDMRATIEAFAAEVEGFRKRQVHGVWLEFILSGLYLLAGLMMLGQSFPLGLFSVAFGALGGMSLFTPVYRINRTAILRQGRTLGDAARDMAIRHAQGGLIYAFVVLFFYPVIAVYKFYVNWVEGWISNPPIAAFGRPGHESAPAQAWQPLASEMPQAPDVERASQLFEPEPETGLPSVPDIEVDPEPEAADDRDPGPVELSVANPEPDPPGLAAAEPAQPARLQASVSLAAGLSRARDRLANLGWPPAVWAGAAVVVLAVFVGGIWISMSRGPSGAGQSAPPAVSADAGPLSGDLQTPAATPTAPIEQPLISGPPVVVDTATLTVAGTTVRLFGIVGQTGGVAVSMGGFLTEEGDFVTCKPEGQTGLYRCRTSKSDYDVAAAALVNGAASASADAPPNYLALQSQARSQKKGIWQ